MEGIEITIGVFSLVSVTIFFAARKWYKRNKNR